MRNMLSPENRSQLMSLIRSKGNTSTEQRLAVLLRKFRITGWRRHLDLPGRPDFTFPDQRLCIFVHGCFWHGCPSCYRKPRTNSSFWAEKVRRNRARDLRVVRELRARGWRTLSIWECSLRGASGVRALRRVTRALAATRQLRGHAGGSNL